MPENDVYGTWPASGEIDLAESRGNDGDTYTPGGRDSLISAMVSVLTYSRRQLRKTCSQHVALGSNFSSGCLLQDRWQAQSSQNRLQQILQHLWVGVEREIHLYLHQQSSFGKQ